MNSLSEHYWKLPILEERFNKSQLEIKKLASTWMLIGFAAIASLLRFPAAGGSSPDAFLLPTPSLLLLVSLLSAIGLLVLWIVDHLVYQRMIREVVAIAVHMERSDSSIPPIRTMTYMASLKGLSGILQLFYFIPALVFLAVSAFATYWQITGQLNTGPLPWILYGLFLILLISFLRALRMSHNDHQYREEQHERTGFGRLIEMNGLKDTVSDYNKRHSPQV